MKFRLILVLILYVFTSCKKDLKVPKTLEIAFKHLDSNWNENSRLAFQKLDLKENAPVFYGLDIENELQEKLLNNHPSSKQLNFFFDSLGIHNLKDKSGLILNTYHNYLNNIDIKLNAQALSIIDYWTPIYNCEKQIKTKAISNYSNFKINDTIVIQLPVDEHNNAVEYKCPDNQWVFIENKDLKITALIERKSTFEDSLALFFRIKILSKSQLNTEIMYKECYEGDRYDLSLNNSWKIRHLGNTDEKKDYSL